jgi:eukaryotic-like serine/threonine-protein kinase
VTGRRIGPYQLLEVLGEGGIGQVYMSRDTVLGRHVAIKMLRPELSRDRSFITRFHNEAQSLGDLGHANITTLYALHLEGQEPFMVMELVHGHTLEALLARMHRFPVRESLAVVAQIVAGLAFAHRRGVIHRDIKPANLMVTDAGVLKIMDFGIARVRGTQRLTRAGQMFGTLLYASPEQIKGNDVDERSDLYSLAVVLYEMLAGSPPFTAENELALMTSHLQELPPPLTGRVSGLDPQVEPALMRALAKDPEERFGSIEEFARAIGASAVRGDAADILQDFVAPIFRNAPARTRLVNTPGDISLPPAAGNRRSNSGARQSLPRRQGLLLPWPKALRHGLRLPATALGAVALALVLSLGYFVMSPKGSGRHADLVATDTPGPGPQPPRRPSTEPPAPAAVRTVDLAKSGPPPQSSTVAPVPTPTSTLDPAKSQLPPSAPAPAASPPTPEAQPPSANPPALPIPPAPSMGATQEATTTPERSAATSPSSTPLVFPSSGPQGTDPALLDLKLASRTTPPPQSEPPAKAFEAPSEPKPDIRGTVSGVESASRIKVGAQWLDIYGINDPTQRAHTREVLAYLQPSRGVVECYQKADGRYQCYADGKDLALLALQDSLARPAADAPPEYRSVSAQSKSARH